MTDAPTKKETAMRTPGMDKHLRINPVKRCRLPSRAFSPTTLVRRGKSAMLALVVSATGLFYLPAALAVPTYIYTYTGKPFDQGPFFDPSDPRAGGSITMRITSPTALFASEDDQKATTGLNFSMSDSAFSLKYPTYQPPYDYYDPIVFSAALHVYDLGSDGLPTSWDLQLGRTEGRHNESYFGLQSSYGAGLPDGNIPWDNSNDRGYGPMYIVNNPGQWHMYIETNPSAVPELPASGLLGVGSIVMLAAARSSKRRRTQKTQDVVCR
jgi:hypothetical protein